MLARLTTHRETCFGTHQVAASCMKLSSDWIKQRESHTVHGSLRHLLENKFALDP